VSAQLDFTDIQPRVSAIEEAFRLKWERFRYFALPPSDPKFTEHLKAEWSSAGTLYDMAVVAKRELDSVRIELMGKKSALAAFKKDVGRFCEEQRRNANQAVRNLETALSEQLGIAERHLQLVVSKLQTEREALDVTLPGRRPRRGHLHPITVVRERIEDIFVSLGYAIEDDREIETDFYAEHSRYSSGARAAGHVLHHRRICFAFADVDRADSRDATPRRAAAHDRAGPRVSSRHA
jgi:phenylalanyl-tRNA synthetase alpha subunit